MKEIKENRLDNEGLRVKHFKVKVWSTVKLQNR